MDIWRGATSGTVRTFGARRGHGFPVDGAM